VVHVQEIDLNLLGLKIPSGNVGVVMMQPFLRLTNVEPYRCRDEAKREQISAIKRTLEIARNPDHGAGITHFTLIPEYSIPGLDGVGLIQDEITNAAWPCGTVVIGGTDALDINIYRELCAEGGTTVDHEANDPDKIPAGQWINCCIIWVKAANGEVKRWVQPKLVPAALEHVQTEHQPMFHGQSVFIFKCAFDNGVACRFFPLVCFDWIGFDDGEKVLHRILDKLHAVQLGELHWVFVIQHNRNPSHPTFLSSVNDFFVSRNQFPGVVRDNACLVFANTAANAVPGRADHHGSSSVIFSPLTSIVLGNVCHSTYSGRAARIRGTDMLGTCKDALFRERGACIHSFSQRVPRFLVPSPGDKTLPLPTALVHPIIANGPVDARINGHEVPGCVKWLNDELDTLPCLSQTFGHPSLASQLPAVHGLNIANIRSLDSHEVDRRMKDAMSNATVERDADFWDAMEADALQTMVHVLDIVRVGFPDLDISRTHAHGKLTSRQQVIDVLAVRGETHEQCLEHANRVTRPTRHKFLLVSRDHHNRSILAKEGKIYAANSKLAVGEPKITDVESGTTRIGFADLLDFFEIAGTQQELQESLNGRLAV